MMSLDDMEDLLSTVLPAGHPAGSEFASFEKFCDRVEEILAVPSLDDASLGLAFDRWSDDRTPEEFVAELKASG